MSLFMARRAALIAPVAAPAEIFAGDTMFNPKWAVLIVALGVFALAASYDAQLGWAVGVILVVITAVYLWIRVRFAMDPGTISSDRSILSRRLSKLAQNRREALDEERKKKDEPPAR